jgi:hypothetical protein
MSDIKIVQLTDQHKTKVTPYVAASAVYYQYTEDGRVRQANMETVYGGIDANKILETQNAAVNAINSQATETVEKILAEGDSYQNSIDELAAMIERIDNRALPLEVETVVSGDTSNKVVYYSYSLTEYDAPASGASITVTENANCSGEITIYAGSDSTWTSGSTMHPGTDEYKFSATKGGKSVEKVDTRHLWFYRNYGEIAESGDISNGFYRKFTGNGTFDIEMIAESSLPYLWLIIPDDVTLESVTSEGIEVTMEDVTPENFKITIDNSVPFPEYASYKEYRTVNALADGSVWNLSVKIS